ncbi:Nn.00g075960.m01.CDS01 [Neocucurbitaria sp. VM-36]
MASSLELDHFQSGPWTEYAANKAYILVSERTASIISIVLAFALWLSLLRSYKLFRRLSLFLLGKIPGVNQAQGQGIAMQNLSTGASAAAITHQVVSEESTPERVLFRLAEDYIFVNLVQFPNSTPRNAFHQRWVGTMATFRGSPIRTSVLLITGLLYFGLAAGYQGIAILTSSIIGHNTAHSAYENTGAWYSDIFNAVDMVNTSIFPAIDDLQTDIMLKAVAYAESCYKEKYSPKECSLFYTPQIQFVERNNASCPFEGDMCSGAVNTAYELDTGWADANMLGINKQHTCHFRMRKVCSPLIADGYIRSRFVDDIGSQYVEYQYGDGWGTTRQGNKTFGEVVPDPHRMQEEQGRYLIREIKDDAVEDLQSPRKWIPELQARGSRVSLFFVRPINIAYTHSSGDPIFPATKSPKFTIGNDQPLFINQLQRSTVFACTDTISIRHPKHHIEWHPRHPNNSLLSLPEWKDPNVLSSLHMVNVSFLARKQIDTLYSDMSMHFNAPRRIRSFYSSPLEKDQWKLEVKKMFNTELALLQFNVLGIAQGIGHDLPRAKNLLDEFGIDARGKVLFPAPGAKNIKVAELMGFVVACMACWLLAIECIDASGQKVLWVTTLLHSMWNFWNETVKEKFDDVWVKIKNVKFDEICDWLDEKLGLT